MDSVTQFALGAVVGMAVVGRATGARKAALVGGVLATLPDLDVLFPFDNPIDSFVQHRSASHSLIVHSVVAPLLGWPLARWLRLPWRHASLAVWLILATHALLDAMTIYGTQLGWPVSRQAVGIGSLFIIDPLYTLPLLLAAIAGLAAKGWGRSIAVASAAALLLSTAYAGWSVVAQARAAERATALLERAGVRVDRLQATPLPFNTLFWRVIAVQGPRYLNIYVPLLADEAELPVYRHARVDAAGACALVLPDGQRLERFADGFVKALAMAGRAAVTDLRMGVTPNYVFSFVVSTAQGDEPEPVVEFDATGRASDSDWRWLWAGIGGDIAVREAERGALVTDLSALAEAVPAPSCSPAGG